jgi:hypothetical protein
MNAVLLGGLALAVGQVVKPAEMLKDQLATPITIQMDQVPLADAVSYLRERYNLPIAIDTKAFGKNIGAERVTLPMVEKVPLEQVLRRLLRQVGATYRIEKSKIIVAPILLS